MQQAIADYYAFIERELPRISLVGRAEVVPSPPTPRPIANRTLNGSRSLLVALTPGPFPGDFGLKAEEGKG